MKFLQFLGLYFFLLNIYLFGQSASFNTFINPVIPGDHPDCTISKIGNDFYTTGSSFNVTPVIYHSTDLVHWEAIAQPVSAAWSNFGDTPGGGCWGGHIVFYNGEYWDYFSRSNTMYFVKAAKPEGPWSEPVRVNNPSTIPYSLGYDNSIFIDDNNKWYLVVKNGQPNNGIVELGDNGQPTGLVYNLPWINPAPAYPYSWAEGPVMWKHDGYYYYSFARDLSGGQKVMRSDTLTADSVSWQMMGDLFNLSDPKLGSSLFESPNHASPVVILDDSTSWLMHPLYAKNEWKGQGRQGLLNQVHYNANGKPTADYPINSSFTAPKLPSSGIPWMVPKSDFFDSEILNPEWSFLGYTLTNKWSLTDRPGWLRLTPRGTTNETTVIKNDGEHNYSIITRLDFSPAAETDEAGLWIMRGDEKMYVKLVSTLSADGKKLITFSLENTKYEVENTVGDTLWLKLVRINHKITGFYSSNGNEWTSIGQQFDVSQIDSYSDFSTFTGTRQGLYVKGRTRAYFDLYIYRDAYTPILAECPANQYGTSLSTRKSGISSLDNINNNDWALYAGIEFGNAGYMKTPDSLVITASSNSVGGIVEVWLDSLDSNNKIAECTIGNTGGLDSYKTFTTKVLQPVTGCHDVYLRFMGAGSGNLFRLQWFNFSYVPVTTGTGSLKNDLPKKYSLEQNFPNPFNPNTIIKYELAKSGNVELKVYDIMGRELVSLVNEYQNSGSHSVQLSSMGHDFSSGIYFYTLKSGNFIQSKKMILLK